MVFHVQFRLATLPNIVLLSFQCTDMGALVKCKRKIIKRFDIYAIFMVTIVSSSKNLKHKNRRLISEQFSSEINKMHNKKYIR